MMHSAPLTIGIEEEYQLIDPATGELAAVVQQLLHDDSIRQIGDQVKPEFLQSQIEIGSAICHNVQEARAELVRLRREVNSVAERHGYGIMAASTHPFAKWEEQEANPGERYEDLKEYMQEVARQMLIFGMHVHVGFGTSRRQLDLLIDIQNQLRYFLPHLLTFSTSSPFWHGHPTGLKSYRSIIFENLPRTGTAPIFSSFSEFERLIETFGQVGTLGKGRGDGKADYTKIWWDSRPHEDFGTLEIRICDICTTVDEAVAVAALVQALVAKLIKLRNQNLSWRIYPNELIAENKWRAVRWGLDGQLIDYGKREAVSMRDLAYELLEVVDDVVDELGSRDEVNYVRTILEKGTSSDRQLAVYKDCIANGATQSEATKAVVDHLRAETLAGVV
ncbi:MAG: carboxylate-amine ligase [Chloroflexi bacterium]|nr:carboxylate-amine ligase [Chloroflexota bacterium]